MITATIGIDPGLTGAVAVLVDGQFNCIYDMPTEVKKSGKKQINARELFNIADEIKNDFAALGVQTVNGVLELSSPAPMKGRKQGAVGMMGMGDSYGCARMFLAYFNASVTIASPRVWKKAMGLNTNKEYSRTRAAQVYPSANKLLTRKKDHNRAESLLLARYLLDYH